MKTRIHRIMLTAASLSCSAMATPTTAQATSHIDLSEAVYQSVLAICVQTIVGKFDLNDSTALAPYDMAPAADEAELRGSVPGIEAVRGSYAHGDILIARAPGGPCLVLVTGSDRLKARDALVAEFARYSAPSRAEPGGGDARTYYFTNANITVQTGDNGTVNFAVKPLD